MTKKTWIIVAIICVGILGGLIAISRGNQIDVSNIDINSPQTGSTMNGNIADHTLGNMKGKVILIEYADYQCPGCASAAPVLKKVMEKYNDQIGLIVRNFPLYNAHPNAFAAASAAEAAGLQGKFWEMHEYLFTNRDGWTNLEGQSRTDYFVNTAKTLGLNTDTFLAQMTDKNVKKKIDFDYAMGQKAKVSATPSIFIDGKNVADLYFADGKLVAETASGAQAVWSNADAFGTLVIEPALKAKGISVPES